MATNKPVRTLDNLLALLSSTRLRIEDEFKELHHFSKRPPFNTKPLGFSGFVRYCQRLVNGIMPGEENEQTIQRTYAYVELRSSKSHAQALQEAWLAYPLAGTR